MSQGKITELQYTALQRAFDFFNNRLFGGALPQVFITLNRKRGSYGYFWPERFIGSASGEVLHEISLNPDHFADGDTAERILSTLVHEQAHLWQQEYGKAPRKCYHNRQWADKMESIGLIPSTTGMEGGARTGQKCSHYIMEEGEFYWACADFFMCTDAILITSLPFITTPKSQKKSKIAYVCEDCGQKAWAKPDSKLICGECQVDMEPEE